MNEHTVKLNQVNMLCHKCVSNVVKGLFNIKGIKEFDVNLKQKKVKIIYKNDKLSREKLQNIVNELITKGRLGSNPLYNRILK